MGEHATPGRSARRRLARGETRTAYAPVARSGIVALSALRARVGEEPGGSGRNQARAEGASGDLLLVWQSRRQEEGGYGIFARRFDAAGNPVGDEVHVNTTTVSMQMHPAAAYDDQGGAWFAWQSFGQDGELGGIVARRFDPTFRTATSEVLVNQAAPGDQTDPVLAVLPDGGAFVVWTSADAEERCEIRGRRLAGDGTVAGDAFRVDSGAHADNVLAAVATDAEGGAVVTWASSEGDGTPAGIRARRFSPAGEPLGDELRIDDPEGVAGIEPALALTPDGGFVVAWLEAEADDYGIRLRRVDRGDEGPVTSPVHRVDVVGSGYTSGLAVDVDEKGDILVAWSRFGDGPKRDAGLFARLLDRDGNATGDAFRVTEGSDGDQRLAPCTGSRRILRHADGRMAFAWTGDADLGDSSGAHLTLLAPEGIELAVAETTGCDLEFAPVEETASPHVPPTYDPLARRAPGTDLNLTSGNDFDFLAVTYTGWTPPDPHMAAGPNQVVVIVNGEIAFFDDDGTNTFRDEIEDSYGFGGAQGATGFVFDPEVIYDPHSGRFMAMACERGSDTGRGYYLLAISDDSNPNGTWYKYRIDSYPTIFDTDIDSPNIAVDANVIYLSADFFGPDKLNIMMIAKSSVISGGTPSYTSLNISGDQSQGFPVTYDTSAPAQYLIGFNFSTSTQVKMYAIKNALTSPTIQNVNVTVPSYSHPEDPPQQGTSVRPETFEARFWSAVYRNGHMWATHHVNGSRVRQRWYEFDMRGWPDSGMNPILLQSGEIDLGSGIRTFFGSIWVDNAGNAGMTYARSATSEYISMETTWRAPGDAAGTMRTPTSIITSTSADTSGRWGDYSAVVSDPITSGAFWAHHEYRTSSWRTRVAYFEVDSGGPDPVADFFGTPTSGDEDLLVTFTDISTGTGLSSWYWDFGDTGSSATQHPTHLYVDPGTYTVSLSVTGTNGTDTETKPNYIVVNDMPDAGFSYYNGTGFNPFIFTSTNLPVLGTNWVTQIDGGSVGASGLTFAVAYSAPFAFMTGIGELLIDVSSAWMLTHISGGGAGISTHTVLLPNDPVLAGIHAYTQGLLNNVGGVAMLTNAIDATLGY